MFVLKEGFLKLIFILFYLQIFVRYLVHFYCDSVVYWERQYHSMLVLVTCSLKLLLIYFTLDKNRVKILNITRNIDSTGSIKLKKKNPK